MFHGMVSARHPLRMTALEPLERAIKLLHYTRRTHEGLPVSAGSFPPQSMRIMDAGICAV